jgi:WD40 repeat protein
VLYKAFVSYSHAADGKLAPAIQHGLHRFGRFWYQGRAMRVFRDETNLSASPGLWSSIETALAGSEYFIVLVSPEAALSKWVCKEVEYWVSHRSPDTMLLILTDGNIVWDAERGDFDRTLSAVPAPIRNVYREEPHWVDLRWIRHRENLSLQDPRFRDKIADIASTLLGRAKDELVGADVRQRHTARRVTISVIAALLLLTITSIGAAIWANRERKTAFEQEQIALARQLAAQAELVRPNSVTISTLLAIESARLRSLSENNAALQATVPLLLGERVRMLHDDAVTIVKFSNNGGYLATASQDKSASVFEVPSGDLVARFPTGEAVEALAISPEGQYLAIANAAHTIQLFDVSAKKLLAVWPYPASFLAISPDRHFLASASVDGAVHVLDTETRKVVAEFKHGPKVVGVAFSPDGRYMVSGSYDMTARVLRTADWTLWHTLRTRASIAAIAISSDSKYVALGSYDTSGHIYEASSGKELQRLPAQSAVTTIAFSRGGRYVAIGGYDKIARIFETATGKPLLQMEHESFVDAVAFSADSRFLATGESGGPVRLFDVQDGTPVARLERAAFDLSPEAGFLATANPDGTARLLDISGSPPLMYLKNSGQIFDLAFSPDRRLLAITTDEGIQVFTLSTGAVAAAVQTQEEPTAVALSSDDRYFATALGENTLGLFQVDGAAVVARLPHPVRINAVAFTPNDRALVTASTEDKKVRTFDLPGGKLSLEIPNISAVDNLAFTPDGKYLASRWDKTVEVHAYPGGELMARFDQPFQFWSVAISPDGKYLATGNGDQTIGMYDIGRRTLLRQANDFGGIWTITFSHDGRYIATGSSQKSSAVFDAPTAKEMARWDCGGEVRKVAFSLDDKYVLCAAIHPTNDGVAIVHRVLWSTPDLLEAACSGVGRNFYNWEWQRYFGDMPYRKTCPALPDPNLTKGSSGKSTSVPSGAAPEGANKISGSWQAQKENSANEGVLTKPVIDYSADIKRVRDMGNEGSVVGQAVATALEFQIAKATHEDHPISARYIYYVARQASGTAEWDSGAVIADAITALSKNGAVEDSVWPYVPGQYAVKPPAAVENAKRFRITNAKQVKGLDELKSALIQNGPVVAGITLYQSAFGAEAAKTGVIPLPAPKERVRGGHAIVIVGYDDNRRRVKFVNSWGSGWGDHGFGYLSYEYIEKYMVDAWTFNGIAT